MVEQLRHVLFDYLLHHVVFQMVLIHFSHVHSFQIVTQDQAQQNIVSILAILAANLQKSSCVVIESLTISHLWERLRADGIQYLYALYFIVRRQRLRRFNLER